MLLVLLIAMKRLITHGSLTVFSWMGCLTTVVDYKGRRFLAQSTVPGIMSVRDT